MAKKTKFESIRISHDRRHLTFINEVKEALAVSGIKYTTKIVVNEIEQYSEVFFYTKTQRDCDQLAALTEMVARRIDTPKNLGKLIKNTYRGGK